MPSLSVYVGGLGEDTQKEDLEREFGHFGKITKVWVARNPPGFAFIDFKNADDADKAIKDMNGATINGRKIKVDHSSDGIKRGQERGRVGFHGGRGKSDYRGGHDRSFDRGFRRSVNRGYDSGSGYRSGGGRRYDLASGYRSRSPIPQRSQSPVPVDPLYKNGLNLEGVNYKYAPLLLFSGIFQRIDCSGLSSVSRNSSDSDGEHP